jgi:hypothetical protein
MLQPEGLSDLPEMVKMSWTPPSRCGFVDGLDPPVAGKA